MPFQMIFGDDEHTARDGPYKRLLATRKWLYIGAAMAALLSWGAYDENSTKTLIKIVDLPFWIVRSFVLSSVGYLILQYAFLLVQLSSVYDLVLRERFAVRRQEDLSNARFLEEGSFKEMQSVQSEADSLRAGPPMPEAFMSRHDQKRKRLEHEWQLASIALSHLTTGDPATRVLYRGSELAIDALRLLPPLVLGIWALVTLARHPAP